MRLVKILLFLILVLRINLFILPSFKVDMNGWKAWSYRLSQTGPSSFYSPNYFSDYFPGYLYILWAIGLIFHFFTISVNTLFFEFFLKFITSLFDIGSAFYIYKIVSRHNKKFAYFAPVLYLANPAIIFNSSVWGQIDGIFTFFLLASAYFLFEKKQIFKSSITLALGVLVKPQSLAFAPIFLINLIRNFSSKKIIESTILGTIILLLLSFPFFTNNPALGLIQLGIKSQDVYSYTSLFAFNFWGIIGTWKPDSQIFILSLKGWGIVIYLLSLAFISFPLKKKIDLKQYYFAVSLSFFSFFMFLTRMHERYLFPFIAFFLITVFVQKSKLLLKLYLLVSFLHFINLWIVYYYYNFVFTPSFTQSNLLKNLYPSYLFTNNNFKFFSILMLALFLYLMFLYYKSYAKKN